MIKVPERKVLDKLLEVTKKITNPERREGSKESDKQGNVKTVSQTSSR